MGLCRKGKRYRVGGGRRGRLREDARVGMMEKWDRIV